MLRRRSVVTSPAYYKGVPVVNLLAVERKRSLRLFGAEGPALALRLFLVVAMLAGAATYVFSQQEARRYADLEATAVQRASAAGADIDEALLLQDEIEALQTRGSISQRDFDFLKGQPAALIAAIQSVVSLQVNGVSILSIVTAPPDGVIVRVMAESHEAAIEWRRFIATSAGVERVVVFDYVEDTEYIYEAELVSGGD